MPSQDWQTVTLADFRGPQTRLEATDVQSPYALLSVNAEYNPGQVSTRCGFKQALDVDPNVAMTSLYNWVRNADLAVTRGNALAYYSPTSGKAKLIVNLTSGLTYDIFTDATAYGACFASGGSRLYACGFNTSGLGTTQARIAATDVAAIYIDKAFSGPITHKPTLTNVDTGYVTAGDHRIGYIVQSRTGFFGKVSPVTITGTFDTTSTITAPGGQQIRAAFNTQWPADAATVYIVMTTADNPAQFFTVPGMSFGVPPGQWYSYSIDIDISDIDLKATGTDVTQNLNLLTQDALGTGPFNPFLIVEYGQRMVWFAGNAGDGITRYYASDLANPQLITQDQHIRYLPGFRSVSTAFVLDNVLYVLGPHWTYAERDNLQNPVEWPAAELVDGQIGALGPLAATVNSSKGMAWVAHTNGLYVFSGGRYAARPVSYYVDDEWRRVNQNAAHTIQVKDNAAKQQVYVLVPYIDDDGVVPTTPTHIMMFDYSRGLSPEDVMYSRWEIASYTPGAIEIWQNEFTRRMELLVAPATTGKLIRQLNWDDDDNPHEDDGLGIDFQYEPCLLPGLNRDLGLVYRHHGVQFRAKGYGNLTVTTYNMDRTKSVEWLATAIQRAPGREFYRRFYMQAESVSHRFRVNGSAGDYCVLSAIEAQFSKGPSFR